MKVYLDYVFFINFLFDFILLVGINIILKRNVKMNKIVYASLFGAFSFFIIFLNISSFSLFLLKILSGIIMLIIAFNFRDVKYTFFNLIYLMILSIVIGGALYLIDIEVSYDNVGSIFFSNGKYINIFILLLVAILVMIIYIRIDNIKKSKFSNICNTYLYVNNKVLNLKGFIDTGNNLYDPYFHKPILILNNNYKLDGKYILVPFNTINGSGLMKCYFVDKIILNKKEVFNFLVGISDKKINIFDADIILHKDMEGML